MNILFFTFPVGHLVSDKEFERLKKGFAKVGNNLIRWHKDLGVPPDHDVVMVKGFSHSFKDVRDLTSLPLVFYSIGAEFKAGIDVFSANELIHDFLENSQYIVHISRFAKWETEQIYYTIPIQSRVIYPACEINIPDEYDDFEEITLATTCIPRPVKRVEETERLCKKFDINLISAYGNTTDFSYYHHCQGYIHLSRKEGMPNTVLEALSYGLPCITTNYGGQSEIAQVIIENDPENVPWDPDNISGVDDYLFASALAKFKRELPQLRHNVRKLVRTKLNDYVTAQEFNEVFKIVV